MQRKELVRHLLPGLAIVGAVVLGLYNPDSFGSAAVSVLASAVGGHYGLSRTPGTRE